jgi:hypothetical protein
MPATLTRKPSSIFSRGVAAPIADVAKWPEEYIILCPALADAMAKLQTLERQQLGLQSRLGAAERELAGRPTAEQLVQAEAEQRLNGKPQPMAPPRTQQRQPTPPPPVTEADVIALRQELAIVDRMVFLQREAVSVAAAKAPAELERALDAELRLTRASAANGLSLLRQQLDELVRFRDQVQRALPTYEAGLALPADWQQMTVADLVGVFQKAGYRRI